MEDNGMMPEPSCKPPALPPRTRVPYRPLRAPPSPPIRHRHAKRTTNIREPLLGHGWTSGSGSRPRRRPLPRLPGAQERIELHEYATPESSAPQREPPAPPEPRKPGYSPPSHVAMPTRRHDETGPGYGLLSAMPPGNIRQPQVISPAVNKNARVATPKPRAYKMGCEEFDDQDHQGDESLCEERSQIIVEETLTAEPDTAAAPVTLPLGRKATFVTILYACSLGFLIASLVLHLIVNSRCQLQNIKSGLDCTNITTGLVTNAGTITTAYQCSWLGHVCFSLIMVTKYMWIFDKPVARSSIFSRLNKLHHFWTFLIVMTMAITYEVWQFALSNYQRPVEIADSFNIVVSIIWVLLKLSVFILMCILNYTPDLKPNLSSSVPRFLYKLSLFVFAAIHFTTFLSLSVFIVLKRMPSGTKIPTTTSTGQSDGEEIRKVIAFVLLVVNAVFHVKMVEFFSAKVLSTNKNLLHFVHEEIFQNRHKINSRYFSGVPYQSLQTSSSYH
ncbi:uncharacterized protein LOC135828427 [Sycon ciliatum]|uniref:uncharacterized protein LOC135828427 n=1 Tax=Sycon ciliatum TaxID=27933 RepID=UPI0031F61913